MKKLNGYPTGFIEFLILTTALLSFSGILMIPTFLEFKLEWDVIWRLTGEQRLWTAATHLLAGFIFLMVLGALWQTHMRAGLRKKQNYKSGIGITVITCLLSLTGAGLYYLGSETSQLWAGLSHCFLGGLFVLLFMQHKIQGARIR